MPQLPAFLIAATLAWIGSGKGPAEGALRRAPNILIVTVDTLRADRLSCSGYPRPTSPAIDRLLTSGVRFTEARTVEPLTGPALASMLTSLEPHQHGATRNGLRLRPGLSSLPRLLAQGGYRTAAFVGNWTVRDKLTGLGEHFELYEEVLSRKRWWGVFRGEATGEDLTRAAVSWMEKQQAAEGRRPFLLWVHYVEPHAPYRLQEELAPRLGVPISEGASRSDRYDTEVAFADREVGRLLAALERIEPGGHNLVLFTSDHGESLGEHGYWGHGRNVYDPNLRIPMGLAWPGKVPAGLTISEPALITDLAPTVLGLLGLPAPAALAGYDWSAVISERAPAFRERVTTFQAHKGAVLGHGEGGNARAGGLLEVAVLAHGQKEILRLAGARRLFDLVSDPRESKNLAPTDGRPSPALAEWLSRVQQGLKSLGNLPAAELDPESIEQLKALGYID